MTHAVLPLARLVVIAILLIGLLIPLGMTWGLVAERAARRDAVAVEIGAMWGGAQRLSGPALTIPYRCAPREPAGPAAAAAPAFKDSCSATAVVLPDSLDVTGTIDPSLRRRGVFDVVVYRAHLTMKARFQPTGLDQLTPQPTAAAWEDAAIGLGVSDPKGVDQKIRATCNQQALNSGPACRRACRCPKACLRTFSSRPRHTPVWTARSSWTSRVRAA